MSPIFFVCIASSVGGLILFALEMIAAPWGFEDRDGFTAVDSPSDLSPPVGTARSWRMDQQAQGSELSLRAAAVN